MIQHQGIWFPEGVGDKWQHAMKHVHSIEWAIAKCREKRTALQAGGNVGLWPRRLAEVFQRVITFEPETLTRNCLVLNVPGGVEVHAAALGASPGRCAIAAKSLGSHKVCDGDAVDVTTIDALDLHDLDLLQLDIEGYEWHALEGGKATIARCRPIIQVELRDHSARYGKGNDAVRDWFAAAGYHEIARQPGSDFVFGPIGKRAG